MLTLLPLNALSRSSWFPFSRRTSVKIRADYNKEARFFKDRSRATFFLWPLVACFFFFLCFLLNTASLFAKPLPRELPLLLSIETLLNDEAQYDGRRVVVFGRIESLLFQQGRMGSPYLKIVLITNTSSEDIIPQSLEIVSLDFPKARAGDQVLVQGNYHISGQKVGRRFEHFIDAELIVLHSFEGNI